MFDEGHHLFDAADAAFSAALTGAETAELRRWLLGAEGGRSRARGLRRRIEELAAGEMPELLPPMEAALAAARALPGLGWTARLGEEPASPDSETVEGEAAVAKRTNPTEMFLRAVRRQVLARTDGEDGLYDAECDLHPLNPGLAEVGETLERSLADEDL